MQRDMMRPAANATRFDAIKFDFADVRFLKGFHDLLFKGKMRCSTAGKIGQGCYGFECKHVDSDGKLDIRKTVQAAWTRSRDGGYLRGLLCMSVRFGLLDLIRSGRVGCGIGLSRFSSVF